MEDKKKDLSAYFGPIFKIQGGFADNAEKRELVKSIPATIGWTPLEAKAPIPLREYLLQDALDTTLIQTAVYDTIVKGACPAQCMRQAVPVWPMSGNAMTVNIGGTKGYAAKVAEGAEIPRTTEHPTSTTITAEKYADRAEITQEMIDDAVVPVIQYELETAGLRLENALNRAALDVMTTAPVVVQHDAAGANLGMGAVAGAITQLNAVGFTGSDLIMCPEFKTILMKDFLPSAGYFELGDTARTGKLGNLMGVNLFMCNAVPTAGASALFDYDSDNDVGAYLIDKSAWGAIGMRQDITAENYKNPIRDLVGMTVKMRFGVKAFNTSAICSLRY